MLLVGAGLLLQSFARLTHVPVGFAPDGLLTFRVSLPTSAYGDAGGDALVHGAPDADARATPGRRARGRVDGAAAGDHDDGAVRRPAISRWWRSASGRSGSGRRSRPTISRRSAFRSSPGGAITAARHRAVAAGRRDQPGAGEARVAERVADRQEHAGRTLPGLRRSRRRRRRREEQRPRARTDARDVHAVSAAAVAGDAVRGARGRRRSAGAGRTRSAPRSARSIASCRSRASRRWMRRWPIRSRPSG